MTLAKINEILDGHVSNVYATKGSMEEVAVHFNSQIPILNCNELNQGLKIYTNTLIEIIRSEIVNSEQSNERK